MDESVRPGDGAAESPSNKSKLPHAGRKDEAFAMHWSFHDASNPPG